MSSLQKSKTAKLFAGVTGVAVALSLAVGAAVTPASAITAAELAAQIAALQAQLSQLTGGSTTVVTGSLTRDLQMGMTDEQVKTLQMLLNKNSATMVSSSGAGSPGNETTYFGARTKAAVMKFQQSNGITPVAGYVGPKTRGALNAMGGTTGGGTTGGGTTTTGTGLTVTAASQPSASIAPESTSRIPFTKVTLTASNDGDVTVNGVTVERTGLAQDATFAGIVLLDEDGTQIGIAKTLNSNHQVTVGDPFVIRAGQSKTVTIAGNMAATLDNYAGQVAALSVVGVNTSATVNGSFPITGAAHTINATLTIGLVTMNISSFDPNTSITKEVGTTGYKFSGIRITAGSAEKVRLWSIRWNQSGSASSNDLTNVKVVVDGVKYDTKVSTDGKYYTASFGSGIVMDKGFSKDIYIEADVVGSGAAGRTIKFDIYKTTDIYLTGETYGYGITPPAGAGTASDSTSEFTAGTPFFDGSKVTVSAGSATTIAKATSVAAQNIAVNVPNQVLGGYEVDIKGEPISVQQSVFFFTSSSAAGSNLLTNVSIYDENGSVVAGPVDAVDVAGTNQKVTFTDTITYPIGKKVYTIKGKVDPDISNNVTIQASTTPSSNWTTVTGQTTGNSITISNGQFVMNTMTVKTAALAISVSATPSAQSIVAGGQARTFANYQFDAAQSGEDVRFSSIPLILDGGDNALAGAANKLSSCQLYDGSTPLNTGSNVVNPTNTATTTSPTTHTFTLDQSLTIPKGTVKTIALKCNVSSTADSNSKFQWGIASSPSMTVTGLTSSNDVSESVTASNGQLMTISSGSLTVATDSSSPSYGLVAAGTSGNTVGVYRFRATNEAINLNRIGLKLTNTASSSANDLVQVSLWDGSTQIGTATFVGSNTNATSTLSSTVSLPKDTDKIITVKADFANISASENPSSTGHLIAIDADLNTNTRGTGADSGATIDATGSTSVSGVRLFKSYPTVTKMSVPSNTLNNGDQILLRWKVSAASTGDVGIAKFTLKLATTTATVSALNVYAYTDSSFSTPVTGLSSAGQMRASDLTLATAWASSATALEMPAQTSAAASTTVQIPAGATRYFEVRGTVSGATTGASVQTQLEGDAAYPQLADHMNAFLGINNEAGGHNDFIWSPNSTTTGITTDGYDWTNGYGIVGLPATNMSAEVLSK